MKSYLHCIVLTGLLFYAPNLLAQSCTVSNPIVSNVTRSFDANGNCTLVFDLSFTMQNNGGNKTVAIHLWPAADYPTLSYSKAPDATQLAKSYGTIVLNNKVDPPTAYPTYPFGSGVTILNTSGAYRTGGTTSASNNFQITGITIPNINCLGSVDIKGDVWSTNSGSLGAGTSPGCYTQGIALQVGDPQIKYLNKTCGAARTLNFGITTQSPTPIPVSYEIHRDDNVLVNNKPVYDPNADVNVTLNGPQTIEVSSTSPYNSGEIAFDGNTTPGEDYNYWVVIKYTDGTINYSLAKITLSTCAPLPVRFSDFTATRSKNTVLLKWQTATESNNRGFYVQRLLGSGEWQNIAYVFSQADNGNSAALLNYKYTDNNGFSGLTQYRIVQQDLDYRVHFSDVRAVRGESAQSGIVVFPNPSQDGNVMLVFGEPGIARDLAVTDLSGRTIKVLRGVTNNTVTLTNLVSGVYTVHVTNLANATTTVEKIVVTKR